MKIVPSHHLARRTVYFAMSLLQHIPMVTIQCNSAISMTNSTDMLRMLSIDKMADKMLSKWKGFPQQT